ncbi:MAG: protease complex subunit PrcB family protein [Gammaproteobacteria bacterium]|nr:protease complex subunit PrcB family protein [Gammaproteobacteria bacterium]
MRAGLFLSIIFTSVFLSGCLPDSNAETPVPTVPFSVIASGDYPASGSFENRKLEVFRNQASLDASLATYAQLSQPYIVDFSTSQAILINVGQRTSGGYSVKTDVVQEFSDHIKVFTTLTKPGNGCLTTLALTYPFEIIEVQSTKEVIFEQQLIMYNCN